MTLTEIQEKIEISIDDSTVTMEGDGCNCCAKVVSPVFTNMTLLARQKMVLAIMHDDIKSGELHALSVKTYTPKEDK